MGGLLLELWRRKLDFSGFDSSLCSYEMLQSLLKGSWSFRGCGSGPFSQVRNFSFEVCRWLPVLWVAQVSACSSEGNGGLFSQNRPSNCRIAFSPRRGFSFFTTLFPPALLHLVAQTYHFSWIKRNIPFLVGQGDCVVFLLRHHLILWDSLALPCKASGHAFPTNVKEWIEACEEL